MISADDAFKDAVDAIRGLGKYTASNFDDIVSKNQAVAQMIKRAKSADCTGDDIERLLSNASSAYKDACRNSIDSIADNIANTGREGFPDLESCRDAVDIKIAGLMLCAQDADYRGSAREEKLRDVDIKAQKAKNTALNTVAGQTMSQLADEVLITTNGTMLHTVSEALGQDALAKKREELRAKLEALGVLDISGFDSAAGDVIERFNTRYKLMQNQTHKPNGERIKPLSFAGK